MPVTATRGSGTTGTNTESQDSIFKAAFFNFSATDGLTAGTTQTIAGGTTMGYQIVRFTTVASSGDAATLPTALAGRYRVVINAAAANSMQIFPAASTDVINALSAGGAFTLAANKTAIFFCAVDGQWNSLLTS